MPNDSTPHKPVPAKGPNQGPNKGPGNAGQPQPAPQVVQVKPLANRAEMKKRHWGLMLSFGLFVLLPVLVVVYYLWVHAQDQYSSTTAFSVRSEEGGSASDILGGIASFAGTGGTGVDSDILYEFIQSHEMVREIDQELDLRSHYASGWPRDFVFSLKPEATLEELLRYWKRILRISYDQSTGLIEIRVLAFDPRTAQQVAEAVVRKSQDMINALSDQAREDSLGYALDDLAVARDSLREAREALTAFRTRTQIVDPAVDLQTRLGVMTNLQQELVTSLIEYDLLNGAATPSDPRATNALRRITVIRERIAAERQSFVSDGIEVGSVNEDYPTLIAEFERLTVDREFAEEAYRVALTALDLARGKAARQSRYLATYITPTLAQSTEFPQRFVLLGMVILFLVMTWSILALVYYSIRDRG